MVLFGADGECDSGKYYHFWMAAFLSHKNKEYFNKKVNKTTAFFTNVGCQFNAKSGKDRDPPRAFFSDVFGHTNNKIRIDLALAAAAAEFGAQLKERPNTDLKIKRLFTDAEELEPLSEADARDLYDNHKPRAFDRWLKIMTPMSALSQ